MNSIPNPKERIRMGRERDIRPPLCPGDIVKRKRHPKQPRDNRLFVILKICSRRSRYWENDPISYDGEDMVQVVEYKNKSYRPRFVQRKYLWFTGKTLEGCGPHS